MIPSFTVSFPHQHSTRVFPDFVLVIRFQKTREASILADIFLTKSRYSLLKINDHFAVSKLSILSELSIPYYQNYRYYVEIELLYIYCTLLYFTFTLLYFTLHLLYFTFTLLYITLHLLYFTFTLLYFTLLYIYFTLLYFTLLYIYFTLLYIYFTFTLLYKKLFITLYFRMLQV